MVISSVSVSDGRFDRFASVKAVRVSVGTWHDFKSGFNGLTRCGFERAANVIGEETAVEVS